MREKKMTARAATSEARTGCLPAKRMYASTAAHIARMLPTCGLRCKTKTLMLAYKGTSLMRNSRPPQGHHRALGIVLMQGLRGAPFLVGEVPL